MAQSQALEPDEALEALEVLSEVTATSIDGLNEVNDKLSTVRHQRHRGWSWRRIASTGELADALSCAARIAAGLGRAGGDFRRRLTRVLRHEGLLITEIASFLDVSRQRVSALLVHKNRK